MATTQGIKLDENTRQRLKALAGKRNRSPHWLMRAAVKRYLDTEEQYEREKSEDEARWEAYVLTGNAVDNAKVTSWLADLANGKTTPWPK